METLKTLPDLEGRRFGSLALGYDKIDHIRMEFGILESLAALMLNCQRDEVTIPKVQKLLVDLNNRLTMLTADDLAKVEGMAAADLLALAMAKRGDLTVD